MRKREVTKRRVLSIPVKNGERRIPFTPGLSVREILDATDIRVRSACGGIGVCGQCLVRIVAGSVNLPTASELNRLAGSSIQSGIRLACQVRPSRDVRIIIENPAPKADWRSLCADEYTPAVPPVPAVTGRGVSPGVAVDLGTTQIRVSLRDKQTGQGFATRSGLNPQALFGADVLTRVTAACGSGERAAEIGRLARDAIGEALRDIASREACNIAEVGNAVIVGNTAMLTLLTGQNYCALLDPDNWMSSIECRPNDTTAWIISWGLNTKASVDVVQPLAGFIGSDLLAGVIATHLVEGPAGSLLIDFGTNSEIALWDGKVLWVTSAAGGPAFEGCGISCGMPAEPGAICGAVVKNDAPEFTVDVLGGGEAEGICGSGLVDVIAGLISTGILNRSGRFTRETATEGLCIRKGRKNITLKKKDIDVFQRAKAAIAAGTTCLAEKAEMRLQDLKRICVCGAFGSFLNAGNAQAIGLLPPVSSQNIELCGNTALAGCELLLFDRNRAETLNSLKGKAQTINLSGVSEFEDLYIENLYLRPIRMERQPTYFFTGGDR